MPDKNDQAEPGFALVRNTDTNGVYVTKWRGDDIEVIKELEVDAAGAPPTLSSEQLDELVAEHDKSSKPKSSTVSKES